MRRVNVKLANETPVEEEEPPPTPSCTQNICLENICLVYRAWIHDLHFNVVGTRKIHRKYTTLAIKNQPKECYLYI